MDAFIPGADQLRAKYVDLLLYLTPQTPPVNRNGLFDRIERALDRAPEPVQLRKVRRHWPPLNRRTLA